MLADLRELGAGGAFVTCRDGSGKEHLHGVLHVLEASPGEVSADLYIGGSVALHAQAIDVGPVRGWKSYARGSSSEPLKRSIWHIAQYDLALARHAEKLAREQPVGFHAWGCFDGLSSILPAWVFRRFAPPMLAAVQACECGCGQTAPPGRRFVDEKHAGRERQRRRRRRAKGDS